MYILALDTSTDMLACSLGAWTPRADGSGADVELLASRDHLCRRRANEEACESALAVLAELGLSIRDVDAILVGRGPGSFTGVRIGIATAKGLACGLDVPLHGTSTLDAVAWRSWRAGVRGMLGVVGDAMRKEVYPGIYRLDDSGVERCFGAEYVCKVDECIEAWRSRPDADELLLAGDGLRKYCARFEEAGFTSFADEELWFPSGEGLLLAAASPARYDAAETGNPAHVLPIYTRLSDAEENERIRLGDAAVGTTFGGDGSVLAGVSGVNDLLADMHLQLRPMSINDCATIAGLEEEIFGGGPHAPWSEQTFIDEFSLPGRTWWVAHDAGEIIGYAGGMLAGDELEITNVAVVSSRRREGIAARLVERLAYDAQVLNATAALLEVSAQNDAARALYAQLGFEDVGLRKGYYGPGLDAVLMRAELPLAVGADTPADGASASDTDAPADGAPASDTDTPADGTDAERAGRAARTARTEAEQAAINAAGPLILAIESSCDETAMAVVDDSGTIISSVVATQVDFHARFGGVVPEIASRKHVEALVGVYEQTLEEAAAELGVSSLSASDFKAVGVTYGPGLVGALVVGIAFAKGLCAATGAELIAVNHLEGHIFANLLTLPELEPPFVASVVSGGNTMLVHVRDWGSYEILGETIDDAVGEAFDKVAKLLGLGYPGGPIISKLAERGNPRAIRFPRAMIGSGDYRFSLSGLKTSVMNYVEKNNAAGRPIDLPDLCASFEAAVIDVQVSKAVSAVEETGVSDFCLGGGVAANPALRAAYECEFSKRGVRVTIPPHSACTDNAEMIALVARYLYGRGEFADLSLDAAPNLRLA